MRRRLVLAAAFVALLPAARAITPEEAKQAVSGVLPELESIRGIKFAHPLPVTVIDDAKARAYALARFHRMTPDAKIRADETAYRLLGLVPPGIDVVKTLLDVLEEQAGGFYDPQTKSFYLLNDMPEAMAPMLTAHEMTHALEDQRYDIDGRIDKLGDDDDAAFALSSVAEGSATLASAVYLARAAESGKIKDPSAAGDAEKVPTARLNAMPPVLRRQLLGPYVLGMAFLLRGNIASLANGFPKADVDAVWDKPPRSSEQILHPEKYWDASKRDDPVRVTIADAGAVLGKKWMRAGSGILGELTIGGLVGVDAPGPGDLSAPASAWTNAAATGWGGDRYELWTRGKSAVALLATEWDTEGDAMEFERALRHDRPDFWIKRSGTRVVVVAGAPAAEVHEALLDLLVKR